MYFAPFRARNTAQILQNGSALELAVCKHGKEKVRCAGRELQSALPMRATLRRNRLPRARQWPEVFALQSCPEIQPLHAHLCIIRVIKGH